MFKKIAKSKPWQAKERIVFDEGGLTVLDLQNQLQKLRGARWSEIVEITGWYMSVMYGDIVYVDLTLRDRSLVRIDEEIEGWREFAAALSKHLPGCPPFPEWEARLIWPGQQENGIVIFKA